VRFVATTGVFLEEVLGPDAFASQLHELRLLYGSYKLESYWLSSVEDRLMVCYSFEHFPLHVVFARVDAVTALDEVSGGKCVIKEIENVSTTREKQVVCPHV
jgi:hypothetical protein